VAFTSLLSLQCPIMFREHWLESRKLPRCSSETVMFKAARSP